MNFLNFFIVLFFLVCFVSGSSILNEDSEINTTSSGDSVPTSNAIICDINISKGPVSIIQYKSSYMALSFLYASRYFLDHPISQLNTLLVSVLSITSIFFLYLYSGISVKIIFDTHKNLYGLKIYDQDYPEADRIIPYDAWIWSLAPFTLGVLIQNPSDTISGSSRLKLTLTFISTIMMIEALNHQRTLYNSDRRNKND